MTKRFDNISFLTDYGTRDEFVGIVKCVIADIAPHVRVIDITHDVPPQDIRVGSRLLVESFAYFPQGTIFLCVVDPGVGSARAGEHEQGEADKNHEAEAGRFHRRGERG